MTAQVVSWSIVASECCDSLLFRRCFVKDVTPSLSMQIFVRVNLAWFFNLRLQQINFNPVWFSIVSKETKSIDSVGHQVNRGRYV
jgi:hypothetical protein